MRTRSLAAGAAIALALGLLTALPASAAYQDPLIEFPGGTSVFYSPFSGPATVTFTFDADTNDATFELRLRRVGGAVIRTREVFIDPDTMASPHPVSFSWPALSVGSAKTYQVAVYRGGNLQGSPESFQVLPPLVSITGATPNPFLPWIDDDIKDETRILLHARGPVRSNDRPGLRCRLAREVLRPPRLRAGWRGAPVGEQPLRVEREDVGRIAPAERRLLRQDPSRGCIEFGGRLEALQGRDRPDLSSGEDEDQARAGLPPPECLDPHRDRGRLPRRRGCREPADPLSRSARFRVLAMGPRPIATDPTGQRCPGSPSGELSIVYPAVGAHQTWILVHRERGSGRSVGGLPHRHGEDHVQLPPSILTRRGSRSDQHLPSGA